MYVANLIQLMTECWLCKHSKQPALCCSTITLTDRPTGVYWKFNIRLRGGIKNGYSWLTRPLAWLASIKTLGFLILFFFSLDRSPLFREEISSQILLAVLRTTTTTHIRLMLLLAHLDRTESKSTHEKWKWGQVIRRRYKKNTDIDRNCIQIM